MAELTKKETCLMLKTPDNRHFFTDENNFPQLIEFGRTFGTEISLVRATDVPVQELDQLARSICTQAFDKTVEDQLKFEVLEMRLLPNQPEKKKRTEQGNEVKTYIRTHLKDGGVVKFDDLANKFTDLGRSTLSHYFTKVREEMRSKGYNVIRESPGNWKIKMPAYYNYEEKEDDIDW